MSDDVDNEFRLPFTDRLEILFFSSGGRFVDRSQRKERSYRNFQVRLGNVVIVRARAYDDGEWVFWGGQGDRYPVFSTRGHPQEFVSFLERSGRPREISETKKG